MVLRGNIAPDCAIRAPACIDEELVPFCGPALVEQLQGYAREK